MSLSAQSSRPLFSSLVGAPAAPTFSRACAECEEPISAKRLLAVPGARYCRDCQSHFDVYNQPPAHVLAARAESDGDQHRVGGDSSAYSVGL